MEVSDGVQQLELYNDEQCLLCLSQMNDLRARVDITSIVQEKILQIFPPELILFRTTSKIICEPCHESLESCALFRSNIIDKHHQQTELCNVVKIECNPLVIDYAEADVRTEYLDDSDENPLEQYTNFFLQQSFSTQSESEKGRKPKVTKRRNDSPQRRNEACLLRMLVSPDSQKEPVVACEICGKTMKQCSLSSHKARLHSSNAAKYECDFCSKKFFKKYALSGHIQTHIEKHHRKRPFTCDLCLRTYMTLDAVKTHKKLSHAKREPGQLFTCFCGKTLQTQGGLYYHNKNVHQRQENEKTCGKCNKVLVNSYALKKHVRIYHTEGGQNNYMCNVCGKFFNSQSHLTSHQYLHGDKKFACDFEGCQKRFFGINQLSTHRRITHLKLKEFSCVTDGCDKSFSSNQKLQRHVTVSHQKLRKKCPVEACNFHVGRLDYMRMHIKKHSELSPTELGAHMDAAKRMKLA